MYGIFAFDSGPYSYFLLFIVVFTLGTAILPPTTHLPKSKENTGVVVVMTVPNATGM